MMTSDTKMVAIKRNFILGELLMLEQYWKSLLRQGLKAESSPQLLNEVFTPWGDIPPQLAQLAEMLMQELDLAVPRKDSSSPSYKTSFDEFIGRLSTFHSKVLSVLYRFEKWNERKCRMLKRMEDENISMLHQQGLLTSDKIDFPGKVKGTGFSTSMTFLDNGLNSEYEALLFAVRSALDSTSRLISSTIPGMSSCHSFRKLKDCKLEVIPLGLTLTKAWEEWAEDLTTRRDRATHYTAMWCTSVMTYEHIPDTKDSVFSVKKLQVLKDISRTAISIWHQPNIPLQGNMRTQSIAFVDDQNQTHQLHMLLDGDGHIIAEQFGDLPTLPEKVDADDLVFKYVHGFLNVALDSLRYLNSTSDDPQK